MATKTIPVMHKDLDDPELRELAGELARRTGQNVLDAVKGALRSDLGRAGDVPPASDELLADLDRLGAGLRERMIAHFGFVPTNAQFDDWMYDEHGLPR